MCVRMCVCTCVLHSRPKTGLECVLCVCCSDGCGAYINLYSLWLHFSSCLRSFTPHSSPCVSLHPAWWTRWGQHCVDLCRCLFVAVLRYLWYCDNVITHASIAAGVGRAFCCVCSSVCLFVRALKGKRLELSAPNLVHVYSIAITWHALTHRSKGQRSRSYGYENHQKRFLFLYCLLLLC